MHRVEPSSVLWREKEAMVKLISPTRINSSAMFLGAQRSCCFSTEFAVCAARLTACAFFTLWLSKLNIKVARATAGRGSLSWDTYQCDGGTLRLSRTRAVAISPVSYMTTMTNLRLPQRWYRSLILFWVAMLRSRVNESRRFESTHHIHLQWMSRQSITRLLSVTMKKV